MPDIEPLRALLNVSHADLKRYDDAVITQAMLALLVDIAEHGFGAAQRKTYRHLFGLLSVEENRRWQQRVKHLMGLDR